MKLGALYQLAVKLGMESDVRGMDNLRKSLARSKKEYGELSAKKKEFFDKEELTNPYGDTRVLYGDLNKNIKHLMVGIDIDTSEMLLAQYLRDHGQPIDAVMAHHPDGQALANLAKVMNLQEDIMHFYGVPINVMNKLMDKRVGELIRGLHPINHEKTVDAARHLQIPYLNTHTVTDNLIHRFMADLITAHEKDLTTVGDVMDLLRDIPEFQHSSKIGSGPMISVGSPRSKTGKIAVTDMTGGTSGSKEQYEHLARAGVGTILGMHMKEDYRQEAEKNSINVIITGHMSSDSIGMNLLVDQIEAQGVEIIPAAGFIRVKRPLSAQKSKKR